MFRLSEIVYSNFRGISSDEKPFHVTLQQDGFPVELLLLDGPNGYGKTTLYDAIELLLTGRIAHFKTDLLNRGEETYDTLKNNLYKEIIISGRLIDNTGQSLNVTLTWNSEDNYDYHIDGEMVERDSLMKCLGINRDFFNIGAYISQSESLSFLSRKYKDRRSMVARLLGDDQIEKATKIESALEVLSELCKKQESEYLKAADEKSVLLSVLNERISHLPVISGNNAEFVRLFPERSDLVFDLPPSESQEFASFSEPLILLQKLIENYENIRVFEWNTRIDDILKKDIRNFRALYEQDVLQSLRANRKELDFFEILSKLTLEAWENVSAQQFEQWSVEYLPNLGFNDKSIVELRAILNSKRKAWEQLGNDQKALEKLDKSRKTLLEHFHDSSRMGLLSESDCPFCGRNSKELDALFAQTGEVIKSYGKEHQEAYATICISWVACWTEQIEPAIRAFKMRWENLHIWYVSLKDILDLKGDQLAQELQKVNETSFSRSEGENFEEAFVKLKERLVHKKVSMNYQLRSEEMHQYKQMLGILYQSEKPVHTVLQVQNKLDWLAEWFRNKTLQQLEVEKKNYRIAHQRYESFKEISAAYKNKLDKVYYSKFKDAVNEYNTKMLHTLRLPVYLYSGRILQNHPLGLGVYLDINSTQLVFRASPQDGSDVYNQLSTGQLNGLAISVLLAVHDICGRKHNLDLLMIDDPLQTIDDISAISLADMLSSSHTAGQIILSTHENSKADLIWYKFKQRGKKIIECNMQQKFLSRKQSGDNV